MSHESPSRTTTRIVEFCRFARDHGLSGGVKETLASLQAVGTVGLENRETVKLALRAVLCSSKEDWDIFDTLFEDFWSLSRTPGEIGRENQSRASLSRRQTTTVELMGLAGEARSQEGEGKAVTGATAFERLRRVDFSQVPQNDLRELERLAALLLRRMAWRLSRRLKSCEPRGPVDLRRTIRRSISRGGDAITLSRKGRRIQRARLVILLDVSGSMNAYSLFLVRFAYALEKQFRRVNTFVFSTRLQEITRALGEQNLEEALALLSDESTGWAGGTKIGESLLEFNARFARRLLSRDTLVMVLSDGWDTGEPLILARELGAIRRRSRLLVWLNPLLGSADYQPVTLGMSAALPFIDIFAPAHNLLSLLELERHLERRRRPQHPNHCEAVTTDA
ncbi:MAG TPA: VWA domain-containing protein [Terriglobales bacterium]